ncbi:hypothetical protein HDU67_004557, partial [Dinochytrium kinnereticum]
ALELVNRFNSDRIINRDIWINQPEVWTFLPDSRRAGEKCIVEPMIANFEKFNSNTGWTPAVSSPWIKVMQALSHHSYHTTNRALLYCDLQGGVYPDGFVITDPVIMSATQEYGPTDLGPLGISTFFSRHQCNEFCNRQWMRPHDQTQYFEVQQGSAMVLPTRKTRAPLTRMSNLRE